MDDLMKRLDSYNFMNNLIPGAAFCFFLNYVCDKNIYANSVIENLLLFYFAGMVMSRIGSLVVEPLFRKFKISVFSPSNKFIPAESKDKKIQVLLESANAYRSIVASMLSVFSTKIYISIADKWCRVLSDWTPVLTVLFILVIFSLSYKKQIHYIIERVQAQKTCRPEGEHDESDSQVL